MPSVRDDYEFVNIISAATTIVSGVACKLIRIVVNTTAAGTTTIYNAPTSAASQSTNTVGKLPSSAVVGDYDYGVKLAGGLVIVTGASSDLTVVYANA